jgi:hypothetical protein
MISINMKINCRIGKKILKIKLCTVRADAVLSVTAMDCQQVTGYINIMYRQAVVPMNGLGDYLAMQSCQITPAGKKIVLEVETGALLKIVLDYGNNGCCQEIRHNFILHFRSHQLAGNNPFCLMRAAIVRNGHLTDTVVMVQSNGIMLAAAIVLIEAAGNSGNDLVRSAVQAVMMYKGIPKTA